jgi:hypothetical protein
MTTLVSSRLQRIVQIATSRNDLILAFFLVAVIFMMILPLPTWLVDTLIGINMTISAILLMVAMYLPSPLAFSSFPSVLLVTTLFRLGISIATTRLILLQGDAGHIILTFGNFVVGGNLVVGLVVFLILTIVQFVVTPRAPSAWPKWRRVSRWTPCRASRCRSTATCAPAPSTWTRPSAAATSSRRKASSTAPWTAP